MEFSEKSEKNISNSESANANKPENLPETDQETTLKQNEAVPETPLEQDETQLKPHGETDEEALTASKVNQVLRFRSQGFTYRAIAAETELSLSTIARILRGVNPPSENSAGEDGAFQSLPFQTPPSSSAIPRGHSEPVSPLAEALQPQQPQNYFLKPGLTASEWSELSKKDKAALVGMVGQLQAQNSSLQATVAMRKGNGDSLSYHANNGDSAESEFWSELAKTERIERALKIKDRYSTTDKKEYPSDLKQILEIARFLAPKSVNELEIWKAASEDTRKNLETLIKKEETNQYDIELENLRQSREVDMEKLKWEQEKWREQKEDDNHKWSWVGTALNGPLGEIVKKIGSAGAERVRGQRLPKPIQTVCPSCNGSIFVDESSNQDLCGRCGAVLARQMSEPQPQKPAVPSEETQENNSLKQEKNEETSEVKTKND